MSVLFEKGAAAAIVSFRADNADLGVWDLYSQRSYIVMLEFAWSSWNVLRVIVKLGFILT